MVTVSWQQFVQKEFELTRGHCFDNKPIVVGKEEKAATSSRALSGLEDHLSIEPRVQRLIDSFE
jgi:hypothetical protein